MPPFPLFVSSRHRVYHREDKSGFVIERNARQSFLFVADPSVRIWRFILPQPPEPVSSGTEDPSNRCSARTTQQQRQQKPTPRNKTTYDLLHQRWRSSRFRLCYPRHYLPRCFYPSRFTGFRNWKEWRASSL